MLERPKRWGFDISFHFRPCTIICSLASSVLLRFARLLVRWNHTKIRFRTHVRTPETMKFSFFFYFRPCNPFFVSTLEWSILLCLTWLLVHWNHIKNVNWMQVWTNKMVPFWFFVYGQLQPNCKLPSSDFEIFFFSASTSLWLVWSELQLLAMGIPS